MDFRMRPIGYLKSMFHFKNGTPRQASICESARGVLTVEKDVFNNPEHSMEDLDGFSHAWIIFVFHKNNNPHTKAKVKPPRLNGRKVGVFSTRSPYRPNNIGLSLVKIDKVEGSELHISGLDILDGTPVLDIKPYIPEYDQPKHIETDKLRSAHQVSYQSDDSHASIPESTEVTLIDSQDFDTNVNNVEEAGTAENGKCSKSLKESSVNDSPDNVESSIGPTADGCSDHTLDAGQQVAEGFYELSAALDKVKEKLESPRSVYPPNSDSQTEDVVDSDISSLLGSILDGAEDDLNSLVGGIISKAAFDLTNESAVAADTPFTGDRLSTDKDSVSNKTKDHDSELSISSAVSSSRRKKKGGEKNKFREKTKGSSVTVDSIDGSCSDVPLDTDSKFIDDIQVSNMSEKMESEMSVSLEQAENPAPHSETRETTEEATRAKSTHTTVVAPWLENPPVSKLSVKFTVDALKQLDSFHPSSTNPDYRLQMLSGPEEVQKSISDILREEPRSVYRRKHCQDSLYFFSVDTVHVTCWFNEDDNSAQVVRVKPVSCAPMLAKSNAKKDEVA